MQSIAPTSLTSSSTSIITSAVQAPLPVNLIPPMYTSHMYSVPALPPLQSGIHPLFPNPAMLPLQSAVSSNSIVNPLSSLSSLYSNRSPAITNDLLHNLVSPNPPVSSNAIFDTPTTAYGSGTSEQQVAQMQNIDPNQQMVVVELNDGQTMKVTWAEYQQISLGFTNGPRPELPTPEQVARYRSLGLYSSNPPQNNAISTRSNITQPITSPASIATIPQQPVLAGNDSHLIPAPVAAPIISPMAPTVPSDYLLTGPNTPIVTTLSVGTGGNLHTVPNVPSSSTNEYKKKPDCTTTSTNDRNDNSRSRSTSPHDLDVEGTDDSDRNEFAKSQNSINTWMNTNEFQSDRDDDENDSCISIDKMAGSSNQNRINRQRPSRKPPSVNMDEIFGHSQESNSMHGSSIQSPSPTDDEPESSNSLRHASERDEKVLDGVDVQEMKEFARRFKMARISLGMTQSDVSEYLIATEGSSYSQSAICRFEKLDITARSALRTRPVIERWMQKMSEGNSAQLEIVPLKTKKRKKRTIFRPEETQVLKDYFVRNHKPSSEEFERLAKQLDKTKLEIQVWFNNRRQAVRPTERRAEPQPVLRRFYQP